MSTREINFLEFQRRRLVQQAARERHFLWIGLAVGGVSILAFVGLIIYGLVLDNQTQIVLGQKDDAELALISMREKEEHYNLFYNKLTRIESIIASRYDGLAKLFFLDDNLGDRDNIRVRSFKHSISDASIRTNIEAKNVFSADDIFIELNQEEFKENFVAITYGGLSRGQGGAYTFSPTFSLVSSVR